MESETQELLRLTRENNRMLHAMRRGAFFGGLFKILLWAALIIGPLWYYQTYLAPLVQNMAQTVGQMQQAGGKAGTQYGELQAQLQKLQGQFSNLLPKGQ